MSVSDTLQDWKELVTSAVQVATLQRKAAEVQAAHDFARMQFEKNLDELEDEEREAILSIMAIYDKQTQHNTSEEEAWATPSGKSGALTWLINKVGNEGVEGIKWTDALDAFHTQYPKASTSTLYTALNQHSQLFAKRGLGKRAVLRLTTEGQALFREGA
jgi:hypothetical protein